jgi:hypothetical protein
VDKVIGLFHHHLIVKQVQVILHLCVLEEDTYEPCLWHIGHTNKHLCGDNRLRLKD